MVFWTRVFHLVATSLLSGLGVVGQLVVRLLKRGGARTIVGVDHLALRRVFALQGGANHALQPTEDVAGIVRRLTDGRGADVVVEVSGTAAGSTTVRNRSSGAPVGREDVCSCMERV
jgi:threonine dehydrogenase-like Zn-dependent dehydrogenase